MDIDISVDVLFVNNLPFLVTRSCGLCYVSGENLASWSKQWPANSLIAIIRSYNLHGFWPRTLFVDGKFAQLRDLLHGVNVDASAAGEHVGNIERFIA